MRNIGLKTVQQIEEYTIWSIPITSPILSLIASGVMINLVFTL